jgi:hypothetical protein
MRIAPPAPRASRERDADQPSSGALIAAVFYAIDGMVIGGTTCPGLLLCVPAILLVVTPLVLIAALLVAVGVVLAAAAAPVLVAAKLVARHRERVAAAAPPEVAPARVPAPAPAVFGGALVLAGRGERHA